MLLSTTGKVVESVMDGRLKHAGEQLEADGGWPNTMFGFRRGRSVSDALATVLDWIYERHRRGETVAVIALDLAGAFPNVSRRALAAELELAGFERELRDWCLSFMNGRQVALSVDGIDSDMRPANVGLPQGSSASPSCLCACMARLIRAVDSPFGCAVVQSDDGTLLVAGSDARQLADRVDMTLTRAGAWADATDSRFEPEKGQYLLIAPRWRKRKFSIADPFFRGFALQRVDVLRALGVHLDAALSFRPHVEHRVRLAHAALAGIRSLTRNTRGADYETMHRLVTGVVQPILLFGCEIFAVKPGMGALYKLMRPVNLACAKLISGGWRNTARTALEVEADVMPIELQIERRAFIFYSHVLASPTSRSVRRAFERALVRFGSSDKRPPYAGMLYDAIAKFPSLRQPIETIQPCAVAPWLS